MPINKTHLLHDEPSENDEFGTHIRIATLIQDEVVESEEGRSIAVIGEWGSGKSTVIKLLETQLKTPIKLKDKNIDARTFTYDAWSHQGDPLRRSFLDDLISYFKRESLLTADKAQEATEQVWNRQETTTTTTEPMARKHALLLILSIALVPLGMKIFEIPAGEIKDVQSIMSSCRNLIAMALIIAPLPLLFIFGIINLVGPMWLRRFLFNVADDNKTFSVLSFFFEKTKGTLERKLIKTPTDSVIEFKNIFTSLLDGVCESHQNLRFVIIIDNIDRIPPDHAKEFWSTMQTFFSEDGGFRKQRTRKYWLIAPFSLNALSFVFRDSLDSPTADEAELKAKAYVDKTFGIAVNVPPPILANWRRYLLDQLNKAFPDTSSEDLIGVRDLFGLGVALTTSITPRGLKLFVNGLVILYRQRGGELSLNLIAAFFLHRDSIRLKGIKDDLLSMQEQRIIDDPNWRAGFAALYYGVTREEGNQILLGTPIFEALAKQSPDLLKEQEDKPGFLDVLLDIVSLQIEEAKNAARLTQIAATIGGIKASREPALSGAWKQISTQLRHASDWNKFQQPVAVGLQEIVTHTTTTNQKTTIDLIAKSLSSADVGEPEDSLSSPSEAIKNWLEASTTIVKVSGGNTTSIMVPGSPRFKLEVFQQLSESKFSNEIKAAIHITDPKEVGAALVAEINAGQALRSPEKLIALLADVLKAEMPWPSVIKAASNRLQTTDILVGEIRPLIGLVISAGTIANYAPAFEALAELSKQGFLSNLLFQHVKNQEAKSAIVIAMVLANPSLERPTQSGQSAEGDVRLLKLIAEPDAALIQSLAEIVLITRSVKRLYELGAQQQRVSKLSAGVVGAISSSNSDLDIDPQFLIDQRQFLETNSDLLPFGTIITRMRDSEKVFELLQSQTFEISKCKLYRDALEASGVSNHSAYVDFLERGSLSLNEEEWGKAINAASGPHHELVGICVELRKRNMNFALSTETRDALLEQVREISGAKIEASREMSDAFEQIFSLLQKSLQRTLASDVVEDLIASANPTLIRRTLEFFGKKISLDALADQTPDRIILRILNPILSEPDEIGIQWMNGILLGERTILEDANPENREEFSLRLRNDLLAAPQDSPLRAELQRLADHLSIYASVLPEADNPSLEAG